MEIIKESSNKQLNKTSANDDPINAGTATEEIDTDWANMAKLSRKQWAKDNPY